MIKTAPIVLHRLSIWLRLLNLLVDLIVFSILISLLISYTYPQRPLLMQDQNMIRLMGILLFFAYYFLMEMSLGRTLGKMLTGSKVINEDGKKPSFREISIRTLCRFIPLEFIPIFFSARQCLHDSLSKTYVVRTNYY